MWLVAEKIPLLLLSAACSAATVLSQSGNVATLTSVPVPARIASAVISYTIYLRQFFWPAGLAALYPRSDDLPAWQVGVAWVVLAVLSAAALMSWRRQPAVLVGWLWYLGTLVPMSGLVPISDHARADRYTYLPQIGLCIAVVWGVRWGVRLLLGQGPLGRWLCGAGGALLVAGLTACAWRQTTYWQNSETLWTRALACTSKNFVAQRGLGVVLADRGRFDEAITRFRQALEIQPRWAEVHSDLGFALAGSGQRDKAIAEYEMALKIKPDFAQAHFNLGNTLADLGRLDEAVTEFQRALEIKGDLAEARGNLGLALASCGRVDEAIDQFRQTLEIRPDYVDAHRGLGVALAGCGEIDEALAHFQRALEIKPDDVAALNDVAWIRATHPDAKFRDGPQAVVLAQRAVALSTGDADTLNTLAAAYAEAGRFPDAVRTAKEALRAATAQGNQGLAESLRKRIEIYGQRRPWRDSPPGPAKGH
jgi:tetratricopeptide (TPR) repeat protein